MTYLFGSMSDNYIDNSSIKGLLNNLSVFLIRKAKRIKEIRLIVGLSLIFFLILFIVLQKVIIALVLSLILFTIASFSAKIGQHFFGDYSYGIDLIPFVAILFFYADGYHVAMVAIIAMIFISGVATATFNVDTIMKMFAYAILGLFMFILPFSQFTNWLILAIIYHVLFKILQNVVDTDTELDYIEIPINTLLNYVLFKFVAVWLFPLL